MNDLLKFIEQSPTAFHAAYHIAEELEKNGFQRLVEANIWSLSYGGKYYFLRNDSSVVAFKLPKNKKNISFNITAAHLDSPTFKLKPNFQIEESRVLKLNTEVYGGPILNTWLDRPLNIAGRVIVCEGNVLKTKLVSFEKPMAVIPNCSIHYYPELNKGVGLNPQVDLLPIYCDKTIKKIDLIEEIAKRISVDKQQILSHDLYLSLMDRGGFVGSQNEFIVAPQIDNLECSYACLKSFLASENENTVNVLVEFDNEEIGSRTRQGAGSKMLADTLERIADACEWTKEEYKTALAHSFIVSADNAQGFHPNYPQKYDMTNAVYLNGGIVIKTSARGAYTTDAVSLAYFKQICDLAQAKVQFNSNRSDIAGGSTLGAISLSNVSIYSLDIGLPQLAMHSAMETAGRYDYEEMVKALTKFYELQLKIDGNGDLFF